MSLKKEELEKMSINELRAIAKKTGLTLVANANKINIIDSILTPESESEEGKVSSIVLEKRKQYVEKLKSGTDVDGYDMKLSAEKREGFHRRWVNDKPGRLQKLQAKGYEHVKDKVTGKNIARYAGTDAKGSEMQTYLMEIPEKWYKEDAARKSQGNKDVLSGALDVKSPKDGSKENPEHFKGQIKVNGVEKQF